ncbi:hypothetical protein BH10PSE6_BH10PSE6_49050 [soil metagenome]
MVTMGVAICSTTLSLFSSALAAYAIQRLRADLGRHLLLHSILERVGLRAAFIQSSEKKTVSVAILTELVSGDVYQWLVDGGLAVGLSAGGDLLSFFVDYHVSSLTGAVKE